MVDDGSVCVHDVAVAVLSDPHVVHVEGDLGEIGVQHQNALRAVRLLHHAGHRDHPGILVGQDAGDVGRRDQELGDLLRRLTGKGKVCGNIVLQTPLSRPGVQHLSGFTVVGGDRDDFRAVLRQGIQLLIPHPVRECAAFPDQAHGAADVVHIILHNVGHLARDLLAGRLHILYHRVPVDRHKHDHSGKERRRHHADHHRRHDGGAGPDAAQGSLTVHVFLFPRPAGAAYWATGRRIF